MGGKRQYKARDYAVGEQLLALRMRAELRQAELAALLQVSQRTIHNIRVRVPLLLVRFVRSKPIQPDPTDTQNGRSERSNHPVILLSWSRRQPHITGWEDSPRSHGQA